MEKAEFMRACREGGEAIEVALRSLDRSFYAVLYRDGVRSLRDADAARDLVQETFIKVWSRCATFQGDSELLPWIRSILRHAILDRLRRPDRDVPLDNADSLLGTVEPEDRLHRGQLDACFKRCWKNFEEASPEHAAVMTWIVEDGMSNDEIGRLLERTPGATREFISQCRKRARVHLAEWYELATGERFAP